MKIIEAADICLLDKDVVTIKTKKDFLECHKIYFPDAVCFHMSGCYYLLGSDIAFIYSGKDI